MVTIFAAICDPTGKDQHGQIDRLLPGQAPLLDFRGKIPEGFARQAIKGINIA